MNSPTLNFLKLKEQSFPFIGDCLSLQDFSNHDYRNIILYIKKIHNQLQLNYDIFVLAVDIFSVFIKFNKINFSEAPIHGISALFISAKLQCEYLQEVSVYTTLTEIDRIQLLKCEYNMFNKVGADYPSFYYWIYEIKKIPVFFIF